MFALALLATLALYLFEGHAGLSLWDEGYLWYGSQRVALGEVPMRDFYAYDPARYYFTAAVMGVLRSDGVLAVRIAAYAFQVLGIWALLASLARDRDEVPRWALPLILALALLWMFPRHKLFDASTTLMLIAALAAWVRKPDARQAVLLGAMVGSAACMGRNHGLYAGVAAILALLLVPQPSHVVRWRLFCRLAAGVVVGYSPMLLAMALVPGFASAFLASIRMLFELGSTNLPIPVPWPWQIKAGTGATLRDVVIGLNFVFLLAFALIAPLLLWRNRQGPQGLPPVVIAASVLAIPYTHFAFARADVGHLAQGAIPAMVAVAAWKMRPRGLAWTVALVLLANAIVVMLPMHSGWQARKESWSEVRIAGNERLALPPGAALEIEAVQHTIERHAGAHDAFVATPYWPGAYALMRRRSPTWEIYSLVPRSDDFQLAEIQRIRDARPKLILIQDQSIDGIPQRRLAANQPLLYHYLTTAYSELPSDPALVSVRAFIPGSGGTSD